MDRTKMTFVYPGHTLDPESLLLFTDTTWFENDWRDLGLNDEEDLASLQLTVMCSPDGHPLIKGTGGLRKLRFAPPGWNRGKRGALRVCYTHYEEFGHVLLVAVYPKGVKDDLSDEAKKMCKVLIAEHRKLLSETYYT